MVVFPYIDYFRLVAAILVVIIHTSPLLSMNVTADFVLTRILARVAVPFFFMASGFFMSFKNTTLENQKQGKEHLNRFLYKTFQLYLIAIVLYLPLNLYMGYFKEDFTIWNFLKDLFLNGTIYHLWYLPAAILGALIAFQSLNKLGTKKALIIAGVLYVIGIFGDSYYYFIPSHSMGYEFYEFLFQFFAYTRNGIFFAPIFFILGILADRQKTRLNPKTLWLFFITSMSLMVGEGLLLHFNQIQRHDSMYFMLIPSMYFLFQLLLKEDGKKTNKFMGIKMKTKDFRNISMVIYIIHPLVIVVIRLFGKVTGLTDLLVTYSFLHFICVLTGSILIGILFTKIKSKKISNPARL